MNLLFFSWTIYSKIPPISFLNMELKYFNEFDIHKLKFFQGRSNIFTSHKGHKGDVKNIAYLQSAEYCTVKEKFICLIQVAF